MRDEQLLLPVCRPRRAGVQQLRLQPNHIEEEEEEQCPDNSYDSPLQDSGLRPVLLQLEDNQQQQPARRMACTEAACDSDGSISWEDFIGTTTDLVPQLLGMFDEIARGKGAALHHQQQHGQLVSASLQKRLSIAQRRRSRASTLLDMAPAPGDEELTPDCCTGLAPSVLVDDRSSPRLDNRDLQASPTALRYSGRRCQAEHNQHHHHQHHQPGSRPLSGSSIGSSSTSSSGCSNQGTAGAANPYLASVESLADTCASSQGSGDSGVVTVSESSGGGGGGGGGGGVGSGQGGVGRANGKIRLSDVDRATAARYFDERRPRYCDPHRSPVERVLLEIVDTEADYVEHLRQVIQGYLIYWRNDSIPLLRDSEINGLFSNIEDIYEFNRNFLSALDNSELDPITVANTFTEHNDGFKVYTEYCTNYPRTVSILTKLMGQEDIAREFRERQAALGHDLPLGSFLLKPVQRILKYHLLLENLSREFGTHDATDGGDGAAEVEARAAIVGALDGMTGIARHINEMKRKHEHAVRVQEIQSLLYGWPGPDLTTSGELIAEGSFRMRGAKAPRHAFLFDRMLLLTKRKEDGLLVYKAHILCSNLTLMESIPGEPLSFHVIPFDNSQLQYKLQARNLEQKREWTLQIKRVILENYNAVIPSHARQLVLQIGQNKSEDDFTPERGYKKSTEYFDRKADRRRSETSLRQKLRKGRKSDVSISTAENSPMCPRKNQSAESIHFGSRDENLNRSSEIRGSKIKDRFTSWRRKSEPGFQSYINLHASDREDEEMAAGTEALNGSATPTQELAGKGSETQTESEEINESVRTKENCSENGLEKEAELDTQECSVEEIVGNILKQSQEFQRRLEKHQQHQLQRNPSYLHKNIVKKQLQQRLNKPSLPIDSSEEEESETELGRTRTNFSRREQCFMRAVNAYHQRSFRSQYDSFRNVDVDESVLLHCQRQIAVSQTGRASTRAHASERRSPPEGLKRPNIVTESKVIKTALRIRENCDSASEHDEREEPIYETPTITKKSDEDTEDKDSKEGSLSNYDNLQHTWEGCLEAEDNSAPDCPTKTAVWLTKLCEGLPDQPQKCGSLPRSFQMMNPVEPGQVSKSRFLQRDGKSMTERPFTIASDKPAEINLEDMERYASSCQGSARIAKFPIAASGANGNGGSSASSSTFFCSLDDASFTDADALARPASLAAHVHPDHKIYRANGTANKEMSNGTSSSLSSSSLRNVLSRAGSRLQGLRSSQSTEALECSSEEPERGSRYFRSFSKRNKQKPSPSGGKSTTSDVEETTGCGAPKPRCFEHLPYHKQGSPSLGARIAQADYADPTVLFSESRRNLAAREAEAESLRRNKEDAEEEDEDVDDDETAADDGIEGAVEAQEGDSFYERSFETIENYADGEAEEAFRDSAIFSDVDDSSLKSSEVAAAGFGQKVPPAIPSKTKIKQKPAVTQKPAHLKLRARIVKCRGPKVVPTNVGATTKTVTGKDKLNGSSETKEDDVSAGQSQVGWVKRMVGQLQAQVDA